MLRIAGYFVVIVVLTVSKIDKTADSLNLVSYRARATCDVVSGHSLLLSAAPRRHWSMLSLPPFAGVTVRQCCCLLLAANLEGLVRWPRQLIEIDRKGL
ncbi:hypothetical protein KUV86_07540 [Halomonas sp. DP8Y7-3]|uniref:hypothetical protein n=1 Tax=Halomonas sp. DP8Y7-3 TaxID=2859079 RepID=UPI001C9454B3|nr:hypothetical protein [Halomonas sp. DP8Y7-3]MBY5928962.1 hypothetical protein [Halomonas sp. DP8Y7-3]